MRAVNLEYGWKEYFINQGKKEILKFSCIEGTVHKPREERKSKGTLYAIRIYYI